MDRKTFNEAWFRIEGHRPRLLPGIRVTRQIIRNHAWHILEDPCSGRFLRLNQSAWYFVGLLDGKNTVNDAWIHTLEQQGDDAPTQNEALHILGQLHAYNLLHDPEPMDADVVYLRQEKRIRSERRAAWMNLLSPRFSLWDPDAFLTRWSPVASWLFTRGALGVWLAVILGGAFSALASRDAFPTSLEGLLSSENLLYLYGCFFVLKLVHELAHGFACKCLALRDGSPGEVHSMGILLMLLFPMPFVDASSAWGLRHKRSRILVSLSGVMAEGFLAALAALVWVSTPIGGLAHHLAYNLMVTAGVSTVLLNANPLMRYDGYYACCDWLEYPNLGTRSRQYLLDLLKRYLWRLKTTPMPTDTRSERSLLVVYGLAAMVYRLGLLWGIASYLPEANPVLGMLLSSACGVFWVLLPIGKAIRFLLTGAELARHRGRVLAITAGTLGGLFLLCGLVPLPRHVRAEGVVESAVKSVVVMKTDGVLTQVASVGCQCGDARVLCLARNELLGARQRELIAQLREVRLQRNLARMKEVATAQIYEEKIAATQESLRRIETDLRNLTLQAPHPGTWVPTNSRNACGGFFRRGDELGLLVDENRLLVQVTATQDIVALLVRDPDLHVSLCVRGRPASMRGGTVVAIRPAGESSLPSSALGLQGGGEIVESMDDPAGPQTVERFFSVWIRPDPSAQEPLLYGEVMSVRFRLASAPVLTQLWLHLRQLFQRRFRV